MFHTHLKTSTNYFSVFIAKVQT